LNLREVALGFIFETPSVFLFFGKKDAQIENLRNTFPQFQFSHIRQTHGDLISHKNSANLGDTPEADAQWSELENTGLCISTADCTPVFIFDHRKKRVAGIHAGWRGVAQRLLPKTIQELVKAGSSTDDLQIAIGPHIQQKSFEVQADVKDLLVKSCADSDHEFIQTLPTESKFLVDLNSIVKSQIQEFEIPPDQVFDLHLDTKTDLRFHSHRRDKEKSGRQLSFILLKEISR